MDCIKYNIENNQKRKQREYWIDRRGKIHKFQGDMTLNYTSIHYEIARRLYPESNRPTDILMELGWVLVGSTVYSHPIMNKPPSQSQINKLDKLGLFRFLSVMNNGSYISFEKYQFTF